MVIVRQMDEWFEKSSAIYYAWDAICCMRCNVVQRTINRHAYLVLALTLHLPFIFENLLENTHRENGGFHLEWLWCMYVCMYVGISHLHINVSYFEMKRFLCFKIFNDDKSNIVHCIAYCRQLSRDFYMHLCFDTHFDIRDIPVSWSSLW